MGGSSFYNALADIFEMFEYDFDEWLGNIGYDSSWTDAQLYAMLLRDYPDIAAEFSDWNLNPSWDHGPVNP